MLIRQFFHLSGVFQAYSQWFFHHNMDAERRAGLHLFQVFVDRSKGSDGFRFCFGNHVGHGIKNKIHAVAVLCGIPLGEVFVRFHDTDDLNVALVLTAQQPVHMRVGESHNTNSKGRFGLCRKYAGHEYKQEQEALFFHWIVTLGQLIRLFTTQDILSVAQIK